MSASSLGLLSIQSGQILNPSTQDGAAGGSSLDVDQRACELGAPVPIVFARQRNDKGGILVAPGATEARFENDNANAVTAYYHLVISEGEIDSIPVKDVFQRACRVGSHTQTYDRRAGLWLPGNYIIERAGFNKPEASSYCGSVGLYSGMSTLSFESTIPDGFDQWKKQVHLFIRGGMYVTRLFDSITGPSDNFADLILWMLQNSGRVPAALVDHPALLDAATFLEANGFTCNAEIKEATNILDFIANWAPYFLLGESNNGGKKGLRPLLPTNADGTLKIEAISAEYTFNESLIVSDSFSIEYINYADRLPFVAQLTWRQELGNDAAILRTSEVRFVNTPASGPFESYDLSAFCTCENHAVKVGAYIVARRATVTHNISFTARPEAHNTILSPGSIVRVIFARESNSDAPSVHDYFYQVQRISKTLTGDVGYECSHFPVDSERRSIVSLYVANTVGNGVLFTTNQTGVTCDIPGRDIDDTIPGEEFMDGDDVPGWDWDYENEEWVLDPTFPNPDPEPDYPPLDGFDPPIDLDVPGVGDIGTDLGGGSELGGGGELGGSGEELTGDNAEDGLGGQGGGSGSSAPSLTSDGNINDPQPDDTLTAPTICEGGQVVYFRNDSSVEGGRVFLSEGPTYTMVINDIDKSVYAEIRCPDPTSPTGFGEPTATTLTAPVRDPSNSPVFYIGVPTTVAVTLEYTQNLSAVIYCAGPQFPSDPLTFTGGLGTFSSANVISWQLLNASNSCTPGCGSGTQTIVGYEARIRWQLAGGTTVLSAVAQSGSCASPANANSYRNTTTTVKGTSITYDGFAMNVDDFFPPSP